MNKAQIVVLWIAAISIFCVNFSGLYFRRVWKGSQHPVGTETVSVYPADANSQIPSVPVMRRSEKSNDDTTGERVNVYVRNNYREDEILHGPRITLLILCGFGVLYWGVSRVTARKSK